MYRISGIFLIVLTLAACSDSKKELFSLSCSSPTVCTRTANVYVVNVDGLFIEPNAAFVEDCQQPAKKGEVKNPYCQQMIPPGHSETFKGSARGIEHMKKTGFNPTDSDVGRRLELAKKKLYGK
jgi:hypothetical protein